MDVSAVVIMANVVLSLLSFLDVVFFLRLNKKVGLPDHIFVIGASCSQAVVAQWMWMPGVVLLSQLVQPGMEATMYALLAGCHNLGNTVSSNGGALLLEVMGVRPEGMDGEQAQFEHLWMASLLSTLLPLATCILIPYFIPDAKQSESLTEKKVLSDEELSENAPILVGKKIG